MLYLYFMISTGLSNLHTLFHLILNYFIIIIFVSQIIFNYLSKAEEFSAIMEIWGGIIRCGKHQSHVSNKM